jgi:putative lipase involved disintegration of autophagic bodies
MKKLFLALFVILLCLLVLYKINPLYFQVQKNENRKISNVIVYQKIYPSENFNQISIESGKTALDLLNKTSKISKRGEGKDSFITSINNRLADEKKREYWAFYINDKYSEVGAGSYLLKNLDKIEWKIQKY